MKKITNFIINNLSWVKGFGYTQKAGNGDEIVFESQDVKITINYFTTGSDKSLLIGIRKLNENKSYFFHEYLDFKGLKKIVPLPSESDEEFINRFLIELKRHAEGDLKTVFSGDEWIAVPRDYSPYK